MADDWWPLTWIPADLTWSKTSIDWPTAKVTCKGKTLWVDSFNVIHPYVCAYYVGMRRTADNDEHERVALPHDDISLRCFLHEYFEYAEEGECPSNFWDRMQKERNDA
jgi:hypothetical protein